MAFSVNTPIIYINGISSAKYNLFLRFQQLQLIFPKRKDTGDGILLIYV